MVKAKPRVTKHMGLSQKYRQQILKGAVSRHWSGTPIGLKYSFEIKTNAKNYFERTFLVHWNSGFVIYSSGWQEWKRIET